MSKESKTPTEKPNYKILVEQLLLLSTELGACQDFLDAVNTITDKQTFKRVFIHNFDAISTHFDVGSSDEVRTLERKLERKEEKIEELEGELEEHKEKFGKISTLTDEYKVQHFIRHKDNYAEWELQSLFEKGKTLLQSNAIN